MASGEARRPEGADPRSVNTPWLGLVEEALATEQLREGPPQSIMHGCLGGTGVLYNPLLLGAADDTDDLAANAMDFAPRV